MKVIYKKDIKKQVDEAIEDAGERGKIIEKIILSYDEFESLRKILTNDDRRFLPVKRAAPSREDPLAMKESFCYMPTLFSQSILIESGDIDQKA